ncbi:MAG: NAD(P)/FAD-dependent oxidoreductase [Halanaeroarchaeum sp.]
MTGIDSRAGSPDDPIAVVGGGIAGASVAYHLSRYGDRPVVVYERGAIAAETTARSTAVYRVMGDPVLGPMKRYGLSLLNEVAAEPTANPWFELIGRFEVATSEEGADALRGDDLATGTYLAGEDLHRTAFAPGLRTGDVVGARYNPNAGYLRPAEVAHEFVERARSNGVEVVTNTPVADVILEDGSARAIETETDTRAVSHVVAAAGPWNRQIGRLVGLDLPVRHTLAPIARLDAGESLVHTLPNVKHQESGYYLVGRRGGSVLVGHSPGSYQEAGTEYDPDRVGESVPAEVRSGMIDAVERFVPSILAAGIEEEWVGVRSLTPDGRPMVGPTGVDGFSLVAFNSEGIQLAPAAGLVIASHLGDADPPAYADAVSPRRFD